MSRLVLMQYYMHGYPYLRCILKSTTSSVIKGALFTSVTYTYRQADINTGRQGHIHTYITPERYIHSD